MEKKQFALLIPLCIIGFVGFWITTMFMGSVPLTSSRNISEKDSGGDDWGVTYIVKDGDFSGEIAANPDIELYLADVNAVVVPYDGVNISVEVKNRSNAALEVCLARDGDETTQIRIGNERTANYFGVFNFNLFGLFGGSASDRNVVIKIPRIKFDSVNIEQGSGKSEISGIDALQNYISVGSGEFSFARDKNFPAEYIKIDMGSGKASFSGMSAKDYDIDIGSGECNVSGLTGTGDIDMGSGVVNISYDESPRGGLDIGSGSATLTLPDDANTLFGFDIGSGAVVVKGADKTLQFGHGGEKSYTFGDGSEYFKIELGSGKVEIGLNKAMQIYSVYEESYAVQSSSSAFSSNEETTVQSSAPMYASSSNEETAAQSSAPMYPSSSSKQTTN